MTAPAPVEPFRFGLSFPAVAALILLAWTIPGLIGHQPWKPDEAYTFGLVYQLLQTGDWVVPTLAGEPFMEKPPIYYLTAAGTARLFSGWLPLHDAARLASGLYLLFTFLFAGLAARELYGRAAAWPAALLLAGCLGPPAPMHLMVTDTALFAGFALALFGMALSLRRPAIGGLWLGTGAGLCFLAKGLLGPGILGIVALSLPLLSPAWRGGAYWQLLLSAGAAALPWLLIWPSALYLRSPQLFTEWFWVNNLGRFLGTVNLGPSDRPGFYFKTLPWFALPAWPLAAWTLWAGRGSTLRTPGILLPLACFLAALGVLGAASDARQLYTVPLALPLAILGVPGLQQLPAGGRRLLGRAAALLFGTLALLVWALWLLAVTQWPHSWYLRLLEVRPGIVLSVALPALVIAALATLAWTALACWRCEDSRQALVSWTAGLTLVWLLVMTLLLPAVDNVKSYRAVFSDLARELPASRGCVASRGLGEPQRAMLHYYAGLITLREETQPASSGCDLLLVQANADDSELVQSAPGWRLLWKGRRPGDNKEIYLLLRRTRPDIP